MTKLKLRCIQAAKDVAALTQVVGVEALVANYDGIFADLIHDAITEAERPIRQKALCGGARLQLSCPAEIPASASVVSED